jgi:hypothetical protein
MITVASTAILSRTGHGAWQAMHGAHKNAAMRAESGCDVWRFVTFARSFAASTRSLHRRVLAGLMEVLAWQRGGITKLGYGGAIKAQPTRHIRKNR